MAGSPVLDKFKDNAAALMILLLIIVLTLLFGLMTLLRLPQVEAVVAPGMEVTVTLGFMILAGYLFGETTPRIGLPKITGYLLAGVIFGPYCLGLAGRESVAQLKFIDHVALSMIAMSTGRELKLADLRRWWKSIVSITLFAMAVDFVTVSLFVYLVSGLVPFLRDLPQSTRVVAAVLFGLLSVAKSPVTTIAIIEECGARGRFTETILGVIVLKDVLLLIFMTVVIAFCKTVVFAHKIFEFHLIWSVMWEVFGSLAVGLGIGALISACIKYVEADLPFVIIAAASLMALVAGWLHLEALLLSLAAGFYIENFSRRGDVFLEAITKGRVLIYLVFFTITGASMNLEVLRATWVFASALLLVRCGATWAGISLGSQLVEDNPVMRRRGWMGFINQAGVTLAVALIIEQTFPQFGPQIKAVALAMIAITDFIGPPMFRYALIKSGECGAGAAAPKRV